MKKNGHTGNGSASPTNGNGQRELELRTMRVAALSLVGVADVNELIRRLGYASEEDLRSKEGRSLYQMIEDDNDGDYFKNMLRLQERVSNGRIGYF